MVGNKVHLKDFSKVWIGMLFVVSIGYQIILKPITSDTTVIEIVYAIAFSACFSLMPGKINGIDRAIN